MPDIKINSAMTAAALPTPLVVTHSTQYDAGTYPSWKAFDGVASSYWIATTAANAWIKLDFGSSCATVNSFKLSNNTIPEPLRCPNTFQLLGSNNDADWDTLGSYSGQTAWGNGEVRTFTVTTPGQYRYYKLNITSNNGDGSYTIIAELELWGVAVGTINLGQHVIEVLSAVVTPSTPSGADLFFCHG